MAALFTQSDCPLGLLLTATTSTCVCKENWIYAILSELEVVKVGKNRKITRFLHFLRFSTNFEFLRHVQLFDIQLST